MFIKHLYDKSDWGDGEWNLEPDYASFIHDATAFPCLAKRNLFGAWCGYVGVDDGHPLFLIEVEHEVYKYIDVHGSVGSVGYFPEDAVSFAPPRRLWWIGFDAMQDTDLCPYFESETVRQQKTEHKLLKGLNLPKVKIVYRTFDFMIKQINCLADQLGTFDPRIVFPTRPL
jgi:hypothetical protein